MDAGTAARRWVDGWLRAWPKRDVSGIAELYTDDAVYSSHPFRPPDTARSYAVRAFGEEDLVQAWFGEPVVSGDRAAVVAVQPPEQLLDALGDGGGILRPREHAVALVDELRYAADGRRDHRKPARKRLEDCVTYRMKRQPR